MNPQYVPQAQFGAPPQGFPPVKPGPGVSMPPPGLQDSFPGNNNPPQQAPGMKYFFKIIYIFGHY